MQAGSPIGGALPQTDDLAVFVAIADAGSINRAAQVLRLPKSTLSRRLARLEDGLGVRLFVRNRQRLLLSAVGTALLEHAWLALAELSAVIETAQSTQAEPRGRLRVSAPLDLASHAEVWLTFIEAYPQVALTVDLSNRYVDVAREGYDLALRGGRGEDESLVARPVGSYTLVAVASPAYVARAGRPEAPADLRGHSCVLLSAMRPRSHFPEGPLPPHRHVVLNDPEFARQAALRGHGIAILSPPRVLDDLRAGRLVKVLDAYDPLRVPLFAVYPDRVHLRAPVKAFVEHVAAHFGAG